MFGGFSVAQRLYILVSELRIVLESFSPGCRDVLENLF